MLALQKKVRRFCTDRGWDRPSPGSYAKSIAIEAAELLEHFQWHDLSVEEIVTSSKKRKMIMSELADVFIYGLDLANILSLDLSQAISEKLKANEKKYPAHAVRGDRTRYRQIKERHRSIRRKR